MFYNNIVLMNLVFEYQFLNAKNVQLYGFLKNGT